MRQKQWRDELAMTAPDEVPVIDEEMDLDPDPSSALIEGSPLPYFFCFH